MAQEGGYTVALTTHISPELAQEGMARELVHRLQTMRRSAGFDIADYIVTYYQAEAPLSRVIRAFAHYIQQETLSRELVEGIPPSGAYTEGHHIEGHQIVLAVKK